MKKLLLSVILGMAAAMLVASGAYALGIVTESPDIKIVIDSNRKDIKNTPIIVDGRTMLPLREIAAQIGVTDDDEHIKWNPGQKTIYLADGDTVINLKIDDKTATINSEKVNLDVAPIIYADRTYIPVRFVSQSFGREVVWDGSTKSVFICEAEEYNKVREILDKSDAAMKALKNGKMSFSMDMTAKGGEETDNIGIIKFTINAQYDNEKMRAYTDTDMSMFSFMNLGYQTYMADNTVYTKSSLSDEWEKETKSDEEFKSEFEKEKNTGILDEKDTICAGLKIGESESPDEIVLTGDVVLKSIMDGMDSESGNEGMGFDADSNFKFNMIIEKNTYYIKEIVMGFSGKLNDTEDEAEESLFSLDGFDAIVKCNFTDLNGTFEVVPPEGLDVTKAVEKSSYSYDGEDL